MTAARTPRAVVISNEELFSAGTSGERGRGRLVVAREALERSPPLRVEWRTARPAGRLALERIHDAAYLDHLIRLRGAAPAAYEARRILPGSLAAILLAAGAAIEAVDLLLDGEAERVFCLVEPPGHHAEPARGMGFCAVNNVAVAAAHAVARGCQRVLVVDWDVHHGNGTQCAFEAREEVLLVDCHQEGIFPGSGDALETGRGRGLGLTVNIPLPAGAGDAELLEAFTTVVVPVADRYRPELVLVSAGFDGHRDDPLGGLTLTEAGYARLCGQLLAVAARHAQGRLAMVLEGGYSAPAVAQCARSCVEVLAGTLPPPAHDPPPSPACTALLARVRAIHGLPPGASSS